MDRVSIELAFYFYFSIFFLNKNIYIQIESRGCTNAGVEHMPGWLLSPKAKNFFQLAVQLEKLLES